MGKNSTPAPTPDPLIGQAAQTNAALGQAQLDFAKQQYADSQGRQDKYDDLTGKVAQSALDSQNKANQWAQDDRDIQAAYRTKYDNWADQDRATGQDTLTKDQQLAQAALASGQKYEGQFQQQAAYQNGLAQSQTNRYQQNFAPVEDKVASDAMNWDSAARQDQMAAQAKGDVLTAGQQANDAAQRQMMSMGVNPASGKFLATNRANDIATSLAGAGAEDAARNNVRMQGVTLRQQAAQQGQQLLASGQQAASLGMQATGAAQTANATGQSQALQAQNQGLAAAGVGNTTASLGLGQQGAGYAGLGTGLSAGGAATGAVGSANQYAMQNGSQFMGGMSTAAGTTASGAGIANNLYNSQIGGYQAQNQANGAMMNGIGSLVGTGAALYL